jgi:hypothetical protein
MTLAAPVLDNVAQSFTYDDKLLTIKSSKEKVTSSVRQRDNKTCIDCGIIKKSKKTLRWGIGWREKK